jgi:tetratricopeptide (TPR) repeat protein
MINKVKTVIFCGFLLFLAGCGNDRYSLERQYWLADKQAQKIFSNPYSSPPNQLKKAVERLENFSRSYPNSNLAVAAGFTVARLYIIKEEYGKARLYLEGMLDRYSKSEAIRAQVIFEIGQSYEKADNWPMALGQYNKVIREYPLTRIGMAIPIYIAEYYRSKYQPDKMVAALQEAARHYQALAQLYTDMRFDQYLQTVQKMIQKAGIK